jgi:hypothetical protein
MSLLDGIRILIAIVLWITLVAGLRQAIDCCRNCVGIYGTGNLDPTC